MKKKLLSDEELLEIVKKQYPNCTVTLVAPHYKRWMEENNPHKVVPSPTLEELRNKVRKK